MAGSEPHVIPIRLLFQVLCALLVLTGITVAVSSFDFGSWNIVAALGVASVKAGLVLCFFMHLKYEPAFLRRMFYTAISFLAIMLGFIFWDISFRPL